MFSIVKNTSKKSYFKVTLLENILQFFINSVYIHLTSKWVLLFLTKRSFWENSVKVLIYRQQLLILCRLHSFTLEDSFLISVVRCTQKFHQITCGKPLVQCNSSMIMGNSLFDFVLAAKNLVNVTSSFIKRTPFKQIPVS